MIEERVEKFLEKHNMDYLFLLLAELEVERLSSLPYTIKKDFHEKITDLALKHVAINEVPDYVFNENDEENSE